MSNRSGLLPLCSLAVLLAFSLAARAGGVTPLGGSSESLGTGLGGGVTVEQLSELDRSYMDRQRNHIDELARLNLGEPITGDKSDLDILQELLDQRIVAADDVGTLQGMGIVFGDVIRRQLPMKWAIYKDQRGRSRALRLDHSSHFLFPVTMISRRVTVGIKVNVHQLYQKAIDNMKPFVGEPPLP